MAKAKKSAKKSSKKASTKAVKAPKAVKVPNAPANPASKSGIIATCAIAAGITGKQGSAYYTALCDGAYAILKKQGKFVLPGFAKFTVKKKKATKARKGVNPFTKEPCTFKAKPACKTVRARAIKAIK
eukprot:gene3635-5331_t